MKDRAVDAAIWPLGRPSDAHEAPLWQSVCREWVDKVMRPVCVTHLIDELIRHTDRDDPDTTHHDIDKAIEESGNWQEVVEAAGWRSCEDVISEINNPENLATLIKVVNLALQGCTSETPDPDCRFYWVKRTPTWDGDHVAMKPSIIPWQTMRVGNADARQKADEAIELEHGTAPEYELCFVYHSPTNGSELRFSDAWHTPMPSGHGDAHSLEDLCEDHFPTAQVAFNECREAITAWVCYQWLEPHGFVNFDQAEWSSETEWHLLGANEDLGGEVTRNEIGQWFLVSETAGEHLKATGEVVAPLAGSSYMLWGRDEGGQVLHFDGAVQRAMIRSGYLDRVPPLGFLNRQVAENIPGLRVTLGGEQFPFRLEGFSAINAVKHPEAERFAQSILMTLVAQYVREAGWGVQMGPSFESDMLGPVHTFRITDPRELGEGDS